ESGKVLYRCILDFMFLAKQLNRLSSNEYWGDTEQTTESHRRKAPSQYTTRNTLSAEWTLKNLHKAKWEMKHSSNINNMLDPRLDWKNTVRATSSKERRRQIIPDRRQAYSRQGCRPGFD